MTVLVVGAAVSGRAAMDLALDDGTAVVMYDDDPAALSDLPADVGIVDRATFGSVLDAISLVVVSPGVPRNLEILRTARTLGKQIVGETEFALQHTDIPYCAVTGTNGKTTVAGVTAEMLVASGQSARAVGNIGIPLSVAIADPVDTFVIEVSSFQLETAMSFHPQAAAITNIADDHLDAHGSYEAYAAAKARIFRHQTAGDLLTWDADDPGASAAVAPATSTCVPVAATRVPEGGNGVVDGTMIVGDWRIPAPDVGQAFTVDLLIAATLARHMGATEDGAASAVAEFHPGLHRRELVATIEGVAWVNDSKATNPHAALASIRAFGPVVLIAGGRNKGLDLALLPREKNVVHTVAIGEAAPDLVAAAQPGSVVTADSLASAVSIADNIAQRGDTVLLAPGCASFDMFASYVERGDVFRELVTSMLEAR
jgi:UDP-N-acetylmuramoylalanine--D-glutamate ligase